MHAQMAGLQFSDIGRGSCNGCVGWSADPHSACITGHRQETGVGHHHPNGKAGIAAQRYMAPTNAPTTIIGAADVYLSDFGTLSVVPSRFMNSTNSADDVAFLLDPDMAAVAYLRPFTTNELAVTGDNESTQLLAEFTLEVRNEAAHGIIADLT